MSSRMRTYIYADESGDFVFSRRRSASRFFLLTTVTVHDFAVETELLKLRRQLAWEGIELRDGFHATYDNRFVRRRVFDVLSVHDFSIAATIFEKRKAEPRIRPTQADFYGFAWYHHLRRIVTEDIVPTGELLITAASIGTNDMKANFQSAIQVVNNEQNAEITMKTSMWSAASDPCLQVADYCSWAIQRKWERADTRSYELIKGKVKVENDLFSSGTIFYY